MIFDSLAHADAYRSLSPRIARGLDWLTDFSPQKKAGRYDLDGDNLFALVQSYDTVPPAEKRFESHRAYPDLRYVAIGDEIISYAPLRDLQPITDYNAEKDFLLYSEPPQSTPLHFSPGQFAIFYPQDGHKPGCLNGRSSSIKKIVIKVRA
jgi:biofilm protein TabA